MNSVGAPGTAYASHMGSAQNKSAVVPSLPRHDTAEHATQPLGLLPYL